MTKPLEPEDLLTREVAKPEVQSLSVSHARVFLAHHTLRASSSSERAMPKAFLPAGTGWLCSSAEATAACVAVRKAVDERRSAIGEARLRGELEKHAGRA